MPFLPDKDVLTILEDVEGGVQTLLHGWLHPFKLRLEALYLQAPTRACRINMSHAHRVLTDILDRLPDIEEATFVAFMVGECLENPELTVEERKEIQERLDTARKGRTHSGLAVRSKKDKPTLTEAERLSLNLMDPPPTVKVLTASGSGLHKMMVEGDKREAL